MINLYSNRTAVILMLVFITVVSGLTQPLLAQKTANSLGEKSTFDPRSVTPDFAASILHLEAPTPGGETYRGFLRQQKHAVAEKFPRIEPIKQRKTIQTDSSLIPFIPWGMQKSRILQNGVSLPITGGIPNDNTLAISNDGILLSAINSSLYAYDTKTNEAVFPTFFIGLNQIASAFGTHHNYYDPKLAYDPEYDRFILTFLANNRPENNFLIFAFSSTNDPMDEWYVYRLPGNPLDNNRWTDFPCLAITPNEVIYTANLIIPDVSWQVGFDGSIIWQMDKHAAFRGDDSLPARYFHDIRHEGKFVRNLHPVNGATGITEDVFLLSNRNFDLINDTIFIVQLHGGMYDTNAFVDVRAFITPTPYGLAPNGRQANTNLSDPTSGLDINDARVLGAFIESGNIQFVSTSVNPATGLAAIYHGGIEDPKSANPRFWGNIIGDSVRDYAYPNIAWVGQQNRQPQAVIGFLHTSPTDFAGISSIYFSNDSVYSNVIEIKAGENFVRRLSGTYDRWGDYFGLQRKYNDPGTVYASGFYGLPTNVSGTWLTQLISPDTTRMFVKLNPYGNGAHCLGKCVAEVTGGLPPYEYVWLNDSSAASDSVYNSVCRGDTVVLKVIDARGTEVIDTAIFPTIEQERKPFIYPNPFNEYIAIQFNLEEDADVTVYLYGVSGQIVRELLYQPCKAGLNEFTFYTTPLPPGSYLVRAFAGDKQLFVQRVVRIRP